MYQDHALYLHPMTRPSVVIGTHLAYEYELEISAFSFGKWRLQENSMETEKEEIIIGSIASCT
jgi:hypothetical protein